MKNLSLTFALLFVLFSAFSNGDDKIITSNDKDASSSTASIYESMMAYPPNIRFAHEREIVLIAFSVEPCGHVQILESNSSNPEFLDYVTHKLQSADLSYDTFGPSTQYLKLTFLSR